MSRISDTELAWLRRAVIQQWLRRRLGYVPAEASNIVDRLRQPESMEQIYQDVLSSSRAHPLKNAWWRVREALRFGSQAD